MIRIITINCKHSLMSEKSTNYLNLNQILMKTKCFQNNKFIINRNIFYSKVLLILLFNY